MDLDLLGVNDEIRDEEIERSLSSTLDPDQLFTMRSANQSNDFFNTNSLSTIFPSFPKRRTNHFDEDEDEDNDEDSISRNLLTSIAISTVDPRYNLTSNYDDEDDKYFRYTRNKKKSLFFILLLTFLYYFIAMLLTTLIPPLFLDITNDDSSKASTYNGIAAFLRNFCQFLFSPTLGYISDNYGRKRVMILALLCNFICSFLFYLYPKVFLIFLIHILLGKST